MFEPPAVMSCPADPVHGNLPASPPGPFPVSPSSAIRLAYSESNPPLIMLGLGGACTAFGSLLTVQSRAM